MTESNGRTLFQTLRVPFDLKAIFLAFLGLVVLWAGGLLLDAIYEGVAVSKAMSQYRDKRENASDEDIAKAREQVEKRTEINSVACTVATALEKVKVPIARLPVIGGEIKSVVDQLYGPDTYNAAYTPDEGEKPGLSTVEFVIGLIWWFVILAVFGGAICRVVASRIARDEGVGVKEALAFSIKNFPSYIIAPLAVGLAILFFWACILLAGLVVSIPVIGPILSVILYPLTILAGLIIVLIGFGGLLGLLLMVSAVSTERNGALDAVSRAFSYIYSRPLQFFFAYFLIFLFAYIILLVGGIFVNVTASSFASGIAADSGHLTELLPKNVGPAAITPSVSGHGFFWGMAALWIWFLHRILWWGIGGYVIYYILGGTTSIYFQLRRDVDGTEESEIYLEDGQEDEFDFSVPPSPEAGAADSTAAPEAPAAGTAPETPADEASSPEAPAPAGDEPAGDAPSEETPSSDDEPEGEDEEKKQDG